MTLKPLLNQQLLLLLLKQALQLMQTQDVPVLAQPVTAGSAVRPVAAVLAFPEIQISAQLLMHRRKDWNACNSTFAIL